MSETLKVVAVQHPRVRELVTELMTRDEPAFIGQRVANFFNALADEGYQIVRVRELPRQPFQFTEL